MSWLWTRPGAAIATTIEIAGVERRFLRTLALAGVSPRSRSGRASPGSSTPTGPGKTTLLRILATVLAPDAGRLRVLGRDPARADDRPAIRRRLGYMPQEPGFHRHLTVETHRMPYRLSFLQL